MIWYVLCILIKYTTSLNNVNNKTTSENLLTDTQISVVQNESENVLTNAQDIVVFHDDAGVKIVEPVESEDMSLDSLFGNSADLSITSFLERPKVLSTGTLISTDIYGTLGGVSSPPTLMPTSFITPGSLVADKLSGVQGIKYDLEFTIVLNATRFVQGLYGLYFVYTGGPSERIASEWLLPHVATYVQRSQLLHVVFDVACDTKATLKVPWINTLAYTPVSTFVKSIAWDDDFRADGNLGFFFIAPVTNNTAIQPAGESVKFTVYQKMNNVKLYGAAAIPQMYSIKEAKSKNAGPVESTTIKLDTLMSRLSKNPLLGSYVTPLKWVNDIVKDTANVFGWARPANQSTIVRVKRKPMANTANVNDIDNSDSLALSAENSVAVMPSFTYTGLDELDFKNFVSRFTLIDEKVMTTSSTGNLYSIFLSPVNFKRISGSLTHHSTISYLSTLFKQWRGTIVVKITVVRTEFHSARLQISYNPFYNFNPRSTNKDFMQRDIIDIRQHNQITLSFPFASPLMFLPTTDNGISPGVSSAYGELNIDVLDELRAPPSVAQNITLLIEVAGHSDFEFSVPKQIRQIPRIDVIPQMEDIDCMILNKSVGRTVNNSETNIPSSLAIGEKITNLRLLLKRFTSIANRDSIIVSGANTFLIRPKVIQWYDSDQNPGYSNNPDLYSHLGSMFCLSRGGVRIKYLNTIPRVKSVSSSTFKPIGYVNYFYDYVNNEPNVQSPSIWLPYLNPVTSLKNLSSNCILYFNPCEEFGVEFSIPQYSLAHSVACAFMRAGGRFLFPQYNTYVDAFQPCVQLTDNSLEDYSLADANSAQPILMRAGAEDTNFGGFVSIPPMLTLAGVL